MDGTSAYDARTIGEFPGGRRPPGEEWAGQGPGSRATRPLGRIRMAAGAA